jgi:hypothetical protein
VIFLAIKEERHYRKLPDAHCRTENGAPLANENFAPLGQAFGIERSRIPTSGFSASTFAIASSPFTASAQTIQPGFLEHLAQRMPDDAAVVGKHNSLQLIQISRERFTPRVWFSKSDFAIREVLYVGSS